MAEGVGPDVQSRRRHWLTVRRHSDLGSLTLLFYQPIGGLQVLGKDGSWKDVRMVPGTLTVNLADALHFITSEYGPSEKIFLVSWEHEKGNLTLTLT